MEFKFYVTFLLIKKKKKFYVTLRLLLFAAREK
jgi:hypothetical protein